MWVSFTSLLIETKTWCLWNTPYPIAFGNAIGRVSEATTRIPAMILHNIGLKTLHLILFFSSGFSKIITPLGRKTLRVFL